MSWKINLIDNTVEVNEEIAQALFDAQEYPGEVWEEVDEVLNGNRLFFDPDRYEHINFLNQDKFVQVLKNHKVKGRITFLDAESGDKPEFWGYLFDGHGNVTPLTGEILWSF